MVNKIIAPGSVKVVVHNAFNIKTTALRQNALRIFEGFNQYIIRFNVARLLLRRPENTAVLPSENPLKITRAVIVINVNKTILYILIAVLLKVAVAEIYLSESITKNDRIHAITIRNILIPDTDRYLFLFNFSAAILISLNVILSPIIIIGNK